MPSPGIYKRYAENEYYHIFNRGNNKLTIFRDDQDYKTFLKFFWELVKHSHVSPTRVPDIVPLCYCLMPTHFHCLLKQTSKTGITNFMKRLIVKYVMYFNRKHERVGRLFQSIFKAKHIDEEGYLLHLSRYIHLNPVEIWRGALEEYPYSSYSTYLGAQKNSLLNTEDILGFFQSARRLSLKRIQSYRDFVESQLEGNTLEYSYLG
ncbi:MAG: transposase [Candidatus Chisholmbacteria bacterium]|nr:transposase [Candidatus Chisholmbacteria bacterium]